MKREIRNKKRHLGRKLFLSPILLIVLIYLFSIYIRPSSKLEVDFLDVGQGDASLIKIPGGQTILLDAGPDNLVLRRLSENLNFFKRRLDLIIISHYHDDHALGLGEILKRYEVGKIIYSDYGSSSPLMTAIKKIAQQKNIPTLVLKQSSKIELTNNCFLDLLSPDIFKIKNDGNNSLIVKLTCGQQKFLFSGDNSLRIEKALIASGWDLEANVFKASHHGSNSANSEAFLRAVNPQKLIISVGRDNKFGHPGPMVLERAKIFEINSQRTDQAGTIHIIGTY